MTRTIITSVAVLAAWWGSGANFAAAQFGPTQFGTFGQAPARVRPTVSPFVNLRGGGATNYYGIIRPQTDAARSIAQLQNQMGAVSADMSALPTDPQNQASGLGGLQTGHSVTYFNYGHYYPVVPTGAGASLGSSAGYNPNAGAGIFGLGYGLGFGGIGFGAFRGGVGPAVIIR